MNLDNQNAKFGETMFQYLKRKKKSVLESTLNKNRANRSFVEKLNNQHQHDYQQTKREESKQNYNRSNLRIKNSEKDSTTPKRSSILEEERRPVARSFLQMISPIRSKSPIQKQVQNCVKVSPIPANKDSYKDNYTKRMLIQKINTLRDIIQSLVKAGRSLKQKCHFLFVDLKPFFRHLQTCNQSRFEKRTQEMKAQLKAVEPLFKEFNLEASQQCIDSFYRHFSEYLNQLQGNSLAQIQQIRNNTSFDITNQKNSQIVQLRDANKKLERQLSLMNKKCQKLEKCLYELKEATQLEVEARRNQLAQRNHKFEGDITKLKEINQNLKNTNEEISERIVELQNEKRQLKFDRSKYQQQCLNTITKVKSQQQQFLLNEIMVLKKQFNNDLTQMAQLHKIKEEQYLQRIKNYSIQIQKYKNKMHDLIQSSIQIEETMNTSKAQATRFKKQNECLAADMHRINEELYQHWLALKDIKTLSLRLDIFYKFKKIYQQLAFNEQLFL